MNKMIGTCGMCNEGKPLIQAHAIPHAVFRDIHRDNGGSAVVISDDHRKLHRSGKSGQDRILCGECDGRLNIAFDAPTINFLRSFRSELNTARSKVIGHFDNNVLAAFLMSVIWRAALSSDPMYANVALTPRTKEMIRRILTEDAVGLFDIASFSVRNLVDGSGSDGFDGHSLSSLVLAPVFQRHPNGKHSWQFAMIGFLFEIFIPRLSLLRRQDPALLRRGATVVRPSNLDIFDNRALMKMMMAGFSKHEQGHSILRDRVLKK
ncbi:hypothetical protein [Shinella sp. HZN7]|uniref:hypothetical protein n=1 Tax=Shinella sp. (strain HZN7) TaxID=879274 RepID=UPI000B2D8009|nr:hypothetical protein [Shinella sp. HZN7]